MAFARMPPEDALVLVCKATNSRNFSAVKFEKSTESNVEIIRDGGAFAIRAWAGAWL